MARRGGKLLFAPRRKRRPGCLVSFLFLLLILGLVLGLNLVNNTYASLEETHVTVAGLDKELEGFKILHISDLHGRFFGEQQQRLFQLIRLERFHAVCLSGDMVGKKGDPRALLQLLDQLPQDVPVFLIAGDDDPEPLLTRGTGESAKADYITQAEQKGAIYLDSPQFVQMGKRRVWFSPASLYTTDLAAADYALHNRKTEMTQTGEAAAQDGAARMRAVDYQLEVLARVETAKAEMDIKDAYVLLSHLPLDGEQAATLHEGDGTERKALNFPGLVSLIVSGHWNDGQWRLPLWGPVYMPPAAQEQSRWLPGNRALSGLGSVHGMAQHISPGLGTSSAYPFPSFRLFNRPRVSLLTLSARFASPEGK